MKFYQTIRWYLMLSIVYKMFIQIRGCKAVFVYESRAVLFKIFFLWLRSVNNHWNILMSISLICWHQGSISLTVLGPTQIIVMYITLKCKLLSMRKSEGYMKIWGTWFWQHTLNEWIINVSTSFRVLQAPESWSKYTTTVVMC